MRKMLKLTNDYKDRILEFLYTQDKYLNMMLIADIETFGLEGENIDSYIDYVNERPVLIFYRFHDTLLIFGRKLRGKYEDLDNIVKKYNIKNFVYQKELYNELNNALSLIIGNNIVPTYQYVLTLNKKDFKKPSNLKSTMIKISDLKNIIESRKLIPEFAGLSSHTLDIKHLKRSFEKGAYWGYVLKDENEKVLSHASINCQSKDAVMIGGVFTIPEARKKGYAKDCVMNICERILYIEKTPVLFFSNKIAGAMYYGLGFKDYDKIALTKVKPTIKQK
ncbi:GNAT family N-acetyltransferase [Mycoplasma sp. 2045]|uniref:GNAT family N-acetyltransferase n=1 Tax=Mycoplasma sp. 2045 TaxID=2967301 RepID=UPI00211C1454|nr:GNAT family N-acetyltransferase [Mycoplasma sp. 2045]UUM20601.1 GNAT family N-acetyltransferase [Mycoplasma sp. 2045]